MEETAFIESIARDRHDWAPRLIYADWLEDRDDARSTWIRSEYEFYLKLRSRDETTDVERTLLRLGEELSPAWLANAGWRWSLWIDQLPNRDVLSHTLSTASSLFGIGFDFGKLLNAFFPNEYLRDCPLHRVLSFKKIANNASFLKNRDGTQSNCIRITSTY